MYFLFLFIRIMTILTSTVANGAKRFSPARSRNQDPILAILKPKISILRKDLSVDRLNIIEMAAGGGEHAAYFAPQIPKIDILPVEPDVADQQSIVEFTSDATDALKTADSFIHPPIQKDCRQFLIDWEQIRPGGDWQPHAFLCVNMIHIAPYVNSDPA